MLHFTDRALHGFVRALALLASGLLLAPAARAAGDDRTDPLKVVTTTAMIADAVRAVGGDRVEVRSLMGAGVDPHLYKPTRTDIALLSSADVVFANGLMLEGRMQETLRKLREGDRSVWFVGEAVPPDVLIASAEEGKAFDPHVWMSPKAWSSVVGAVRDRLIERLPEEKERFAAAGEAYRREIEALDAYAREVLGTVPERSRVLISAHDAFEYFGREFGFEVMGIQGISTESEAGLRDIERLVSLIVDRGIGAVFVESTVADRNIRALIAGARARGREVAIGGSLFSDAMGPPGTYEGTYLGMIDHNVTTIARALGGVAPERGRLGKLGAAADGGAPGEGAGRGR